MSDPDEALLKKLRMEHLQAIKEALVEFDKKEQQEIYDFLHYTLGCRIGR